MLLTPIVYIHNLKWALPMGLMLGSAPCFMPFWIAWRIATSVLPKKVYDYGDCVMYSMYQRMLIFFVEHYAGTKIYMYGDVDDILGDKENVIYLSNHQSTVDWFVADVLAVRQGRLGQIRYILKDGLKYLPLYGFYFRQHGGIYISRGTTFKSNKAAKDLSYFANHNLPLWLVIFPEGTRYNPENVTAIEASQMVAQDKGLQVLHEVLTPRVRGTEVSLENLRDHMDAVYDITVAYGGTHDGKKRLQAPSIIDFFSGKPQELHIHVRRIKMADVPSGGEDIKQWLHQRFILKDMLLREFYGSSQPHKFPGQQQRRGLSVWETLPSALFFCGLTVASWSSEQGRSLYWKVTVSSTMLGYIWAMVGS